MVALRVPVGVSGRPPCVSGRRWRLLAEPRLPGGRHEAAGASPPPPAEGDSAFCPAASVRPPVLKQGTEKRDMLSQFVGCTELTNINSIRNDRSRTANVEQTNGEANRPIKSQPAIQPVCQQIASKTYPVYMSAKIRNICVTFGLMSV